MERAAGAVNGAANATPGAPRFVGCAPARQRCSGVMRRMKLLPAWLCPCEPINHRPRRGLRWHQPGIPATAAAFRSWAGTAMAMTGPNMTEDVMRVRLCSGREDERMSKRCRAERRTAAAREERPR